MLNLQLSWGLLQTEASIHCQHKVSTSSKTTTLHIDNLSLADRARNQTDYILVASYVVSNRIGMKIGRIVLQVNMHRLSEWYFFYMRSYFQDGGGQDVRSLLAVTYAAASASCTVPASPPSACDVIGSLYARLQFLIHRICVLVTTKFFTNISGV